MGIATTRHASDGPSCRQESVSCNREGWYFSSCSCHPCHKRHIRFLWTLDSSCVPGRTVDPKVRSLDEWCTALLWQLQLKIEISINHINNRHRMRAPVFSKSKFRLHKMAAMQGQFLEVKRLFCFCFLIAAKYRTYIWRHWHFMQNISCLQMSTTRSWLNSKLRPCKVNWACKNVETWFVTNYASYIYFLYGIFRFTVSSEYYFLLIYTKTAVKLSKDWRISEFLQLQPNKYSREHEWSYCSLIKAC